jgi:uncharacterized protein (TIGR02246 family)
MKKVMPFLILIAIMLSSCNNKNKVPPSDKEEAKIAVEQTLDRHWSAVKEGDAEAILDLLTDDALSCGSDSKEFWSKTDMAENIRKMFTDTVLKTDVKIDKRIIRVAGDGNSAIALEQMFLEPYSQKIPVRNVYHLVKVNDDWKFDFTSVSFVPDNEDIGKLNEALK